MSELKSSVYQRGNMHRAGLLLATVLACDVAAAADRVSRLSDLQDGSILYLASVEAGDNPFLIATRRVFPAPRTVGRAEGVLSELAWQRVDCQARTDETERLEWYDNVEASGVPLHVFDLPPNLRQKIHLQRGDRSVFAAVLDAVCPYSGVADNGSMTPAGTVPGRPSAPFPPETSFPMPQAPGRTGVAGPSGAPESGGNAPLPGRNGPNGPDGPAQPWRETPPQGPVRNGDPPPGAGPIAGERPFTDSVFTLGTIGRLAEYVYYDQERLDVLTAGGDRMVQLQRDLVPGSLFDGLVRTAIARNEKERARYAAALAEKQAVLANASLVAEPLPKLEFNAISAFRAELYRHGPSGQSILVFRGSQDAFDWFSNLWLGVDLLSLEAPHYEAARRLTDQIVKTGRKPIVVGHSLGGGMAQYVGQMFGLRVVAFNSSPLPARYIPRHGKVAPEKIRLYSAIEYQGSAEHTVTRADPVSLTLPDWTETLAGSFGYTPEQTFVKAHQHLVAPTCVVSRPEPFRTDEENAAVVKIANTAMNPSALGYLVTGKPGRGAMEKGMELWIGRAVGTQLRNAAWQPVSNRPFDQKVAKHMQEVVADVAVDAFHGTQGAAKMGKVVYDSTVGDIWKAMGAVGMATAKAAAKARLNAAFLPHSMARFNRGMQAAVGDDVFIARAVAAQCQRTATTY